MTDCAENKLYQVTEGNSLSSGRSPRPDRVIVSVLGGALISLGLSQSSYGLESAVATPSTAVEQAVIEVPPATTPADTVTILGQATRTMGQTITINGLSVAVPWMQVEGRIAIADYGLTDHLGLTLLNSDDPQRQPIQWFSRSQPATSLSAWVETGYRYLDITPLQTSHGWTASIQGQTLNLATPATQITAIRAANQPWGQRWVIEVSGPTTAQLTETANAFSLTLGATATAATTQSINHLTRSPGEAPPQLIPVGQATRLTIPSTNANARPVLFTLTNPHRIVVDLRADHLRPLNILWAPGLRWRQQYVTVAGKAFPVYWLQLSSNDAQTTLRPIWADPTTATGVTPLPTMAQRWQAAAAINAGFFNRNNQYPLGAVRYNNDWISGPILSRGVVGWDSQGRVQMDRLSLQQTLTTASGQTFPIQTINSGYVQAGIGLYTPAWGSTYRPINGSETIVTVRNNRVISQQPTTSDSPVAIPPEGYLLALRSYATAAQALPPGTALTIQTNLLPASLTPFPQIVGGGPLLIRNRQIVLDAALEQFSAAFASQAAPRSAIGLTANGELLLVAVHNSPAGPGPTLAELAQLMAQLGSVEALNLDGGSSASLYLGGRLINRHPRTAARVNNGIGVFIP